MNDNKQEISNFERRSSNTGRRIDEIMNDDEAESVFGGLRDEHLIEREGILYPMGAAKGSGSLAWNREHVHS